MDKRKLLIMGILSIFFLTGCQNNKKVMKAEDWKDKHSDIYASYMENMDMEETTFGGSVPIDYLEEYPNLRVFYDGFGFSKEYLRARGHTYGLEDVINTERPKPGASCLACKTTDFIEVLEKDGIGVNKLNFEEFVEGHPSMETISCYDCHKNKPGEINLTRGHLIDVMESLDGDLDKGSLVCGQCHVEYYQDPETKEVILPWKNGLDTDDALKYYDEIGFRDWEHPTTGADLLKAQHPEFETFQDSVHQKLGMSCIDCHMPEIEGKSGKTIKSHKWTSPLKSEEGLKQSCISCHGGDTKDLVDKVVGIQKEIYDKQQLVSEQLVDYINRLAKAIEDNILEEEDLNLLRKIHREAQFKWDYVFVENGEGFHNSSKANKNLDEASILIEEGIKVLEKYNR